MDDQDFLKIEMNGNLNDNSIGIFNISISDTIQYYLTAYLNDDFVTFPEQCEGGAFTFWFDPSVSISELDDQSLNLKVFPNPNNGCFTLSVEKFSETKEYTIQHFDGKVVFHGNLNSGFQQLYFSDQLDPGVYLINFKYENTSPLIRKLLVQY